jgi:PBSX family phage terminase large subunit
MPGSPHTDKDMVIAEGSVRTGKTVVGIDSFIKWSSRTFENEDFIIASKSMGALKRNILKPLFQILKAAKIKYTHNRGDNYLLIGSNVYWLFGANNESSQDVMQGMTAAGAYLDDASVMPKNFVEQSITRCSVEGSKVFINLNPDSPYHYLKTDYIDQADEKNILVLHFSLDDNLTLAESIKNRLTRMFTGLWYKRYILGLWVMAEGAIYDMFDPDIHVVKLNKTITSNILRTWIGCDYGTTNPTCFLLLGQHKDGTIYVLKEYYYDSKIKGKQLSDAQQAIEFKKWHKPAYKYKNFYIDPSAVSFGLALHNAGVKRVAKADNTVIDGIRNISSLLSTGMIKVNEECTNTIKGFSSYMWDAKAEESGLDKPIKKDDHAMDALRYVIRMIYQSHCKVYVMNAELNKLKEEQRAA